MVQVTLYTKEGCHLCDEVKNLLHALMLHYPHRLTEVDITNDPAIHAIYFLTIPVVHVSAENHTIELSAPITDVDLQTALAAVG